MTEIPPIKLDRRNEMSNERIVKKGTRVRYRGEVNRVGCGSDFGEFVLEVDTSMDDLNEYAFQLAMDEYQVEGYVEILD